MRICVDSTYAKLAKRNGAVFGYNARSEVTHDGSIGAWYSYDEIGNNASYTANELNQYIGMTYSYSGETVEEYSPDGEMLAHESWRYYYDAKSRLVSVSELRYTDFDNPYPTNWVEVVVLSNRYDHLDRRIQKITHEATHTYFYDGWLLVKEVVAHTNGANDIVEYHWGNDLSGSRDGAAGIGGLLYLTISNSSTRQLYIPWYDNNGNVMGYWDERGKVAASFSYGAFGETYASGDNANKFPIRFSTKYHDTETGLYYYTKRFYAPSLHRWLTRDPIGEHEDNNLYLYVWNTPLHKIDAIGLDWRIDRDGGLFAHAIPTKINDTFESLASKLRLDVTDYKKWAHTLDSKPQVCKKYRIPNLVVYDRGSRKFVDKLPSSIINVWNWQNAKSAERDNNSGFMVLTRDSVSSGQIESILRTDGLYRYTFTGHGDGEGGINAYPDPFEASSPVERYTKYGISSMVLQACGSAALESCSEENRKTGTVRYNNWELNVAKAGTFIGYEGAVTLLNELF